MWALARRQHGVVARAQLVALGFSPKAIEHRIARGRLHPIHRGVYAVGRPELTQHGKWMAAVLAAGPEALLSHGSAAALWGIRPHHPGPITLSMPAVQTRRTRGIETHRRRTIEGTTRHGIPTTTPITTLVDLAATLDRGPLERAINEADKLDLVDPEALRTALDHLTPRPGLAAIRKTLDRRTFTLTDSELERHFLPIARRAGLPRPKTGLRLNGFKVDFAWPDLGLVVETDGLRYHRTPAQQARDRVRDQAHTVAGLTPLRFTRAQVAFEPRYVERTLRAVVAQLV